MTPQTLNFNEALAQAQAQANQPRQVQEGTPAGTSATNQAWFAAISGQPPPTGSFPTQRAADQWLTAMNASAAVAVDEQAERAREALEVQAERAQQDADWQAYQAQHPVVDPVRAAAQALARSQQEEAEREAAHRADAARADLQMDAMWARREAAQGMAS